MDNSTLENHAPVTTQHHAGNMGRDGVLNVAGMAISTAATFGIVMLLARGEGLASVGDYSTIFAIRAILVLLCGVGMRIALTKYVAAARAVQNYGRLRGVLRLGLAIPISLSMVVAVGLVLTRSLIDHHLFGGRGSGEVWLVLMAVSLPFGVALDLALAASRGFQNAASAALIGQVVEPVGRFVVTGVVVALGFGTTGAVWALTVASIVAAVLAFGSLQHWVSGIKVPSAPVSVGELLSFAVVSWMASLATQGLLWADVVILSALVSSEEVGVYQIATRLVLLAMICVTPLTQSLAPRVAHFWEIQDLPSLRERYQSIILWSWRLTIGIFASLLIVPGSALQLFGDELSGGVTVVYILSCGALFESFAAPSAVLLNQIGRNGINMTINTGNLALNISLNFALIPHMGIAGAALAWSISLALPGLLRIWLVKHLVFKHSPVTRLHVQALLCAFVAAAVGGSSVNLLVNDWWLRLALAVPLVLTLYALGVLFWGQDTRERSVTTDYRRMVARDLATRLPKLRRWVDRRRSSRMPAGSKQLSILDLVSPYRYDVWARCALYEYSVANAELRVTDFPAFLKGARATAYGDWFEIILLAHLGLASSSAKVHARTFEQSVTRALRLLDAFERDGFDSRFPISVTRLMAHTSLEGRALAEDRWITVDGNHRLALLLRSGRTVLEPNEYCIRDTAPRNNTPALTMLLSEAELCGFYAQGLVESGRRASVSTWSDLLHCLSNPANDSCLRAWPEHTRFGAQPKHRHGPKDATPT